MLAKKRSKKEVDDEGVEKAEPGLKATS